MLVAASAAIVLFCLVRNHFWFYDDAFISLRYARHLAQGIGPRWNRTGAPVEGFTSPLHVLLTALLLRLGVNDFIAVRALAFSFHTALLLFCWRWTARRFGRLPAMLVACGIATSFPMLVWDIGGLEAVPFAALCTVGTLLALDYALPATRPANPRVLYLAAIVLGLASFMRMDGLVVSAAALLCVAVLARNPLPQRAPHLVIAAAIVIACVLPWEIFRIAYFHSYLPNTYFAKVYGIPLGWRIGSGLNYWKIYLKMPPYHMPLLVLIAGAQLVRRRWSALSTALCIWLALVGAYIVTTGGDHMFAARFMITLIPLTILAIVSGLVSLNAFRSTASTGIVIAVFLATSAAQFHNSILNPRFRDGAGTAGQVVGEYIAGRLPPHSAIALNVAGATPYYADEYTYIDSLGLNDYEIARRTPTPVNADSLVGHLKGDGQSVLRRHPDFLLLGPPGGDVADLTQPMFLGDREIAASPQFLQEYALCSIRLPITPQESWQLIHAGGPPAFRLTYYMRKDVHYPCWQDFAR